MEEAEDELSQPTHKVFILGGYGGLGTSRDFFMDVHFLALDTWTWEKVPANTALPGRGECTPDPDPAPTHKRARHSRDGPPRPTRIRAVCRSGSLSTAHPFPSHHEL